MIETQRRRAAIVTGGNTGIGEAAVRALWAAGCNVVVGYFDSPELAEALVDELNRQVAGSAGTIRCDVRVSSDVSALMAAAVDQFGKVDVLVNNAGLSIEVPLLELSEEDWDTVLDTNLKGAFLCSQAAAKLMQKSAGGCIVNIASESGMAPIACPVGNAHYAASKHGLIGLTRVFATALGPDIRVNAVAPGRISTARNNAVVAPEQLAAIPLGRYGTAEEVAAVVAFLASDAAGYITGQTVAVGGGRIFR